MDQEGSSRDRERSERGEWPGELSRRERERPRGWRVLQKKRTSLSPRTREMLVLIGLNAILSLFISLGVVAIWDAIKQAPTATSLPVVEHTPTVPLATALPTATSTAGPGEPIIYRVRPGDTLLTIAAQFNVTVEDIMTANNLENPDFIQVGQELLIPVGGLSTPVSADTPVPQPTDTLGAASTPQPSTATPTDTPTLLPVTPPATEPQVVVREISGAGVLADEAVFIFNSGRAVRMEGWALTDVQENVYVFPNLFLGTGGGVRLHTGSGSNSATDLYWGLDAPVWGEPGDVATLRDESGLVIDTFELP
jgi:LysM repeat protein